MKHLQTLSTTLAMLALVSAASFADSAKVVEPAKPVEVAKPSEPAKVADTTKAKKTKTPKAKKSAPMADTAKAANPSVTGGKTCDDVKSKIEENIKAKGVANPILTVTPAAEVKDGKVVGSCGGGSKKIVYTKG
jgi:hypothetical protein